MDGFPSGQRGQTVNLLQIASVVRIHLHPFRWCGGIGRRKGLKIPRGQPRIGSSPITSSKMRMREISRDAVFLAFFVMWVCMHYFSLVENLTKEKRIK